MAYLEPGLAERLAAAAASDDRSVSKEVARRLEASFGERPAGAKEREQREKAWGEEYAALAEPGPRVPPETPPVEPRAQVVEELQRQVPGVQTASRAFPAVPQDLAREVTPRPRGGK